MRGALHALGMCIPRSSGTLSKGGRPPGGFRAECRGSWDCPRAAWADITWRGCDTLSSGVEALKRDRYSNTICDLWIAGPFMGTLDYHVEVCRKYSFLKAMGHLPSSDHRFPTLRKACYLRQPRQAVPTCNRSAWYLRQLRYTLFKPTSQPRYHRA